MLVWGTHMADNADHGPAGAETPRILSERAFALYDEPILQLSEKGNLAGLNKTASVFLANVPDDVRDKLIKTASPALTNGRPVIDQFEVKMGEEPQTVQVTALPL